MRGLVASSLGLVLLLAGEARAAGPCDDIDSWTRLEPIHPYTMPTDGILLLSIRGYGGTEGSDADAIARMSIAVSLDDVPLGGAFEVTDVDGVVAWRPAGPLVPGGSYVVEASLDNSPEAVAAGCAEDTLSRLFTMIVEQGPSVPLTPPGLVVEVDVYENPLDYLDTIACCAGTRPIDPPDTQGSASGGVFWNPGKCAAYVGLKSIDASIVVEHGLPPATAGLVARQVIVDGRAGGFHLDLDDPVRRHTSSPFCQAVVLKNLATGATVTSETVCPAADIPDLGQYDIDPFETLDAECRGSAQTCAIVEDDVLGTDVQTWDLDECTPWPPGGAAEEEGCACAAGESGAGVLVGLGLLAWRRRRGSRA